MVDLSSRAQGALVGLAVGDALGTTLEFRRRDSYEPLTDMIGGGPFKLRAGQWTDDTSMALCLADSLLACKQHNPHDQLQRYVRWAQHGENSVNGHCFDIGNTVNEALQTYIKTGEAYPGAEDEFSAGNGSLMRLAPLVLFYNTHWGLNGAENDVPRLLEMAALSSMTTHRHPAAVAACQVMALFIDHALSLDTTQQTPECKCILLQLNEMEQQALGSLPVEISTIVAGSYLHKTRDQIDSSGYVVHSLEAALWAFWHSDDFATGALLAANLGGDADTVAAIYGQLAGAYYGLEAIPATWREKLAWCDKLQQLARQLVDREHVRLPGDETLLKFLIQMQAVADDDLEQQGHVLLDLIHSCGVMQPNPLSSSVVDSVRWSDINHWIMCAGLWSREECCYLLAAMVRNARFSSLTLDDGLAHDIRTGHVPLVLHCLALQLGARFTHPYMPQAIAHVCSGH